MAKKKSGEAEGSVNKSQAIKDYMAANPGAMPKDVAAALTAQGIETTSAYVSMIKSTMKSKKGGVGRGGARRGRGARPAAGGGISLETLEQAKEVAQKFGGLKEAQRVLEALARLID